MIKRENVADKEIAFQKSSQVLFCPKTLLLSASYCPRQHSQRYFFLSDPKQFQHNRFSVFPNHLRSEERKITLGKRFKHRASWSSSNDSNHQSTATRYNTAILFSSHLVKYPKRFQPNFPEANLIECRDLPPQEFSK